MSFFVLLPVLLIFALSYFRARRLLFPDEVFGSSVLLLFLSLGIFVSSLHLPQNQPQHYINKISAEEIPVLKLSIKENLKPDLYSHKYIAEVNSVNGKSSHGKLLLLSLKDSLKMPFLEGEQLIIVGQPLPLHGPLNPHQFNYKKFMAGKGIVRQVDLRNTNFLRLSLEENKIRTNVADFRRKITTSLRRNGFEKDELAVVQALLLGQKQDISTETYNNFSAAGAIHILAVSGLHVGVILLFLHWLLKPLRRFKKGKILKTFLILTGLWSFAVLAGLSPSVVRAVTMFSFIAISLEINRRTSTLNSIFLSLLLLLLIKPQWIFEVGFQLSYLAVLSIVLLQPLLSNLYFPPNRILKYLWDLLTVTIAAQAGILPLSLYYFHQFPGLFFLTNLLILPFLGIILIGGVLLIFLAILELLPSFLARAYEYAIELLNGTVKFIAEREQFIFRDISFSISEVWAWYILLFFLFLLSRNFRYQRFIAVLFSVIILQLVYIFEGSDYEKQLIVFHKSRNSVIGDQQGKRLQLYHDLSSPAEELAMIRNYKVGGNIAQVKEEQVKNIYSQKGHFLILIDSTGMIPPELPEGSKLLLTGSPRLNLERLLQKTKPSAVIADGSNYPSIVNKWRKTVVENEIPFHYTAEDGAFLIK
ncbi:ComEC/Rec2 family competence protein [Salinimicrobium sp. HB62]|uniref:ComEC/Rec2 family competence protein n=1 Tax=Salinimicrobium sp. HB62 TaxID=3077781 RepID=UPI002D788572|nr:ComEC/Rec2 family competence protein [Salinimicrobium sp. HB62]